MCLIFARFVKSHGIRLTACSGSLRVPLWLALVEIVFKIGLLLLQCFPSSSGLRVSFTCLALLVTASASLFGSCLAVSIPLSYYCYQWLVHESPIPLSLQE